jgi:hypothetical protein
MWAALIQFGSRLWDHWLLLMGVMLMIEPVLDYWWEGYKNWADKYVPRKARARIAISLSVAAAMAASFLAFSDEFSAYNHAQISKDRSKYVSQLQKFYAQGNALFEELAQRTVTDDQIDDISKSAQQWFEATTAWLQKHMGDAATAKFKTVIGLTPISYGLEGHHPPDKVNARNMILNGLQVRLKNIDDLLGSDRWDPP